MYHGNKSPLLPLKKEKRRRVEREVERKSPVCSPCTPQGFLCTTAGFLGDWSTPQVCPSLCLHTVSGDTPLSKDLMRRGLWSQDCELHLLLPSTPLPLPTAQRSREKREQTVLTTQTSQGHWGRCQPWEGVADKDPRYS